MSNVLGPWALGSNSAVCAIVVLLNPWCRVLVVWLSPLRPLTWVVLAKRLTRLKPLLLAPLVSIFISCMGCRGYTRCTSLTVIRQRWLAEPAGPGSAARRSAWWKVPLISRIAMIWVAPLLVCRCCLMEL